MSNETKQEHTPTPWIYQEKSDAYTHILRDANGRFILYGPQDSSGKTEIDIRRAALCVNAMEGIEDPEDWVDAQKQINRWNHEKIEELQKYKTACESINKDNPMAVAENLEDLFVVAKRLMGYLKYTNLLPESEVEYNDLKTLLTKIQSK